LTVAIRVELLDHGDNGFDLFGRNDSVAVGVKDGKQWIRLTIATAGCTTCSASAESSCSTSSASCATTCCPFLACRSFCTRSSEGNRNHET
jgi:hypothetical protein